MSINATLIAQLIVFLILVWFTMSFVWPPIVKALDERALKISEGLSAADKAKAELSQANKRVEEQLSAARTDAAQRLADAERLAQSMIEEAKTRANDEGAKIVAAAKAEAAQEALRRADPQARGQRQRTRRLAGSPEGRAVNHGRTRHTRQAVRRGIVRGSRQGRRAGCIAAN